MARKFRDAPFKKSLTFFKFRDASLKKGLGFFRGRKMPVKTEYFLFQVTGTKQRLEHHEALQPSLSMNDFGS